MARLVLICSLLLRAAAFAFESDYVRQVEEALKAKDAARAIGLAQQGLQQGENAVLRNLLGKAYASSGQMDKALPEFESAVRLQPDDEAPRFDLAQFLLYRQDFQSAVTVLESAQKTFPKSAQIELALGVAYYGQRRFEETVQAFLKTIDLAPEVPQPYMFLGKMLEHAGSHLPEIVGRFAAWERSDPSNANAPLLHAKALLAGSDAKDAEALLLKSIALNGNSWEAYFELGSLMDRKRNYPRAAEFLKKSVQLNGGNPVAHYRLARVYDRLGKKEQADAERAQHARLSEQEKQDLDRRAAGGMSRP